MPTEPRDGTAAVVGGVLVVTPPAAGGAKAVLRSEPDVVLLKASAPSGVGPVPVATADDVRVWVTPDEPRRVLHVEVASDRLTAALSVERVPGARYRLEDQPPNQEVLLRRVPVERTPCPPPSVAELRAALRERGVCDGVDTAALGRLAQGRTRETVAHGLAAVPPRDAEVRLQLAALRGDGSEPFVVAGTTLAVMVDPEPGVPGRTVLGEPIAVRPPTGDILHPGYGCERRGQRVVATVDGHVTRSGDVLTVTASRRVAPDLTAALGEVTSPGSIVVAGSITEGAHARARGDVLVGNVIRRARVEAGGSLVARGAVFDSRLSVGHVTAAVAVYPVVAAPLVDAVTRVETSLGQVLIAARGAGREVSPLRALQLVLDRVAPDLEEQFRLAVRRLEAEAGALPRPALVALRDAQALLREIIVGRRPLDCLATVARDVAREVVSLSARSGRARLEAPFLQGTHARVLGDVLVTGRGLLTSTLVVRGRLEVLADHATVRGGTIDLDGTAELRALHPGTGTAPAVVLRPGSRLLVACIHAGVVVASPSGLRRFDETTADVELEATGPLRPERRPA